MGLKDFMSKMAEKQTEANAKIKLLKEDCGKDIERLNKEKKEKIAQNNEKFNHKRVEKNLKYIKWQNEANEKRSNIAIKINELQANNPNAGKIIANDKAKEKQYQKERIQQLERDHIPFCPKCKSTSITYLDKRKKLSLGRAVVGGTIGGALTGGLGAAAGATMGGLSSDKIKKGKVKCLNCGYTWKL